MPERSRPSPASCSPMLQQSLTSWASVSGSKAASRFHMTASSVTWQTLPAGADTQTSEADEHDRDCSEADEVFGLPLVAPVQPTAPGQPRHGPLDHPTMTA